MSTSAAIKSLLEMKVDFSLMHGDVPIALCDIETSRKFKSISDQLIALEPKLKQIAAQLPSRAQHYLETFLKGNFSDLKRTAAETADLWEKRPSGNHPKKYQTFEAFDFLVKQNIASLKNGLGSWNTVVAHVQHLAR